MTAQSPVASLIRKLQLSRELASDELAALTALPCNLRDYSSNTDIIRQGDEPSQCCLVIDGWLCQFKLVASGRRQITSLHLSGDIPDLQSLYLARSDQYLCTLSQARVAFLPHAALRSLAASRPTLAGSLWRETLVDAAVLREWIVNLGRDAHQRVAHLICEMAVRIERVGLSRRERIPWHLTQNNIAEAAGISVVHVNRMLQRLRAERLIASSGREELHILDWDGLVAAAEFNQDYLH